MEPIITLDKLQIELLKEYREARKEERAAFARCKDALKEDSMETYDNACREFSKASCVLDARAKIFADSVLPELI